MTTAAKPVVIELLQRALLHQKAGATIPRGPRPGPLFAAHDTPSGDTEPITITVPLAERDLAALDARLFTTPFVLVRGDNTGAGTVATLAEARQALAEDPEVATVAGTAVPGVWFADLDPADAEADAEAGQAAVEQLAQWCADHSAPWLIRASGRPGGRHLVVMLPPELLRNLRALARDLAVHHGVPITIRRTLRLLTAPHRSGLPAPVLEATLRPKDLPKPVPAGRPQAAGDQTMPVGRAGRRARRRATQTGESRSEREFGDALAWARAGWGPGRAWAEANRPGSKAAELGEPSWRRWVWCMAVTVVAAEQGCSETEAWQRFHRASPVRARAVGLHGWREGYWQPALAEAQRARPRRRNTRPGGGEPVHLRSPEELAEQAAEAAIQSGGLRAAGEQQCALAGKRPQFAHSLAAFLDVLAVQIASRDGSISVRDLAEAAHLDTKTVRRVRDFAAERGVIYRARSYAGGANDSDAWLPGPAATAEIARQRETSPTRLETPPAPPGPRGQADPALLHTRHVRERTHWRLRCELSAITETTGQTFAQSDHPAARTLRSLWHQRRWWASLTTDQQEQRRAGRRALLGGLHRSARSAWFDWLGRRGVIVAAAARLEAGTPMPVDHQVLELAPRLVHLGMRDPLWRVGGTPTAPAGDVDRAGGQLAFADMAA